MDSPKVFMLASQLAKLGCDRCNTPVEWDISIGEDPEGNGEIMLTGACECRTYEFRVYLLEMLEVKDSGVSLGDLFK